jgi:hypothetical protein
MTMTQRLLLVGGVILLILALTIAFTLRFALLTPATLAAAPGPSVSGTTSVDIHLATVGAEGSAIEFGRPGDPHPDWVSYLPTTILTVPANSVVNVRIDQFDSATGLRNPFWGKVQGVDGGTMHIAYYDANGKAAVGDFSFIDPSLAAHTFAIPDLGVAVPLMGVDPSAPANSDNVVTFSFHTHGPGVFHWQCFVPCGAGTVYNNGGPMQTMGYMAGLLVVQ